MSYAYVRPLSRVGEGFEVVHHRDETSPHDVTRLATFSNVGDAARFASDWNARLIPRTLNDSRAEELAELEAHNAERVAAEVVDLDGNMVREVGNPTDVSHEEPEFSAEDPDDIVEEASTDPNIPSTGLEQVIKIANRFRNERNARNDDAGIRHAKQNVTFVVGSSLGGGWQINCQTHNGRNGYLDKFESPTVAAYIASRLNDVIATSGVRAETDDVLAFARAAANIDSPVKQMNDERKDMSKDEVITSLQRQLASALAAVRDQAGNIEKVRDAKKKLEAKTVALKTSLEDVNKIIKRLGEKEKQFLDRVAKAIKEAEEAEELEDEIDIDFLNEPPLGGEGAQ